MSASTSPPQRLSVREEQRLLTRRRILDATRAVFEESGYTSASIGNISESAGINRATFYLHFQNKPEVFNAMHEELVLPDAQRYWTLLNDALIQQNRRAIREWLDTTIEWWLTNSKLLRAIHEAQTIELSVAAQDRSVFAFLSSEIEGYLGMLPAERRENVRYIIQFLIIQLDHVAFRFYAQSAIDLTREDLLDNLAQIWCGSLEINE